MLRACSAIPNPTLTMQAVHAVHCVQSMHCVQGVHAVYCVNAVHYFALNAHSSSALPHSALLLCAFSANPKPNTNPILTTTLILNANPLP